MTGEHNEQAGGYTLGARGDILEKLNLMQKKKSLLTVQPDGCASTYLATIVQVMPDKGLVVFETSANETTNRQMLEADRSVFTAQVDGIRSRFILDKVNEATLNGQTVFAAPLPETLFWLQQRKCYRVVIPLALPVRCLIPLHEGTVEFGVIDLSISGLALNDKAMKIADPIGPDRILQPCTLVLPGHGDLSISLEVRNKVPMTWANPPVGQRVGCEIQGLGRAGETHLQKFIYEVELQKKRQDERVKG